MKDLTPRKLIEMLEALPENQKDVKLEMCGCMEAECYPTSNIRIEDDGLISTLYGPRLLLIADF